METSLDVCLVPGWRDSIERVRALRQEPSDAAKIPERVCNWSWEKNGKYTKLVKTFEEICCYIYGDSQLQIVLSWCFEHQRDKEITNNTENPWDASAVKESVTKKLLHHTETCLCKCNCWDTEDVLIYWKNLDTKIRPRDLISSDCLQSVTWWRVRTVRLEEK